jgi:triacylglycerol lipase
MGSVHSGFVDAWEAIAAQVVAAIGDKPVTLVGHSLGGSLALICAAALTLAGKPPVAVWAFEPARVSYDLTLRNLLAKVALHLWRNGSDPVPNLPLGGMHPGLLNHIGKPAGVLPIVADHLLPAVTANLPQV